MKLNEIFGNMFKAPTEDQLFKKALGLLAEFKSRIHIQHTRRGLADAHEVLDSVRSEMQRINNLSAGQKAEPLKSLIAELKQLIRVPPQ